MTFWVVFVDSASVTHTINIEYLHNVVVPPLLQNPHLFKLREKKNTLPPQPLLTQLLFQYFQFRLPIL